jgi:basic amino acid/polyamine antiporter, APA family
MLGPWTASLLVVASMVGTGVFTTTGLLVADLRSSWAVLGTWALGGVMALFGALSYGELVAALPRNGGEYQLLTRIYHPALGFVTGVVSLVVGFSAPIAASALAFSEYLARALPGTPRVPAALALIVITSALHAVNVRGGSRVQNVFAAGKVLLVVALIAGGLAAADFTALADEHPKDLAQSLLSPAFAVGLVLVSFAYSGWNAAAYVAGEVARPERNLPIALLVGTLAVTGLYLGLNLVFLVAAPHDAMAGQVEVAHVAAAHLFGEGAGRALSTIVGLGLVSTVGALIMTGPRVYEAMGDDHPRLRALSLRRGRGGPAAAILLQAVLAIGMVLTATFEALLTYVGVVLSVFAGLTVAGVFVLRRREPELRRPYRTLGYPVTPALFVALMAWMVVHTLIERPVVALAAGATLLGAAFVYVVLRQHPAPGAPTRRRG